MAIASRLRSYMTDKGVTYDLVPHPKTSSTHETALAAHVYDDHVAKAVIVKDSRGYAMVVIPGSNWVKLDALNDELNRNFELAEEEEIEGLLPGCTPGAIPPLGPAYEVQTYLDEALTTLANVYFEAGDHEQLIHVTGEAFDRLLQGVRHGHFSHND